MNSEEVRMNVINAQTALGKTEMYCNYIKENPNSIFEVVATKPMLIKLKNQVINFEVRGNKSSNFISM